MTDDTGGTPANSTSSDAGGDAGASGDAPTNAPGTGDGESIEGLRSALQTERAARKANDKRIRDFEAKVREFEDRDKTETERLTTRAETAERELVEFKARDTARTIATAEGVPDMWDLLHGDEEAMTAQAKRLAEHAKPNEEDGTPGDLGAGARGSGDRTTKAGSKGFSAQLRRGAGYRG